MKSHAKCPVAVISSYVPRRCGIATFAHDLSTGLAKHVYGAPLGTSEDIAILAINDRDGHYHYGNEVQFEVRQHRKADYVNAADFLNVGTMRVVSLQHEYGLFGGTEGAYILELLQNLKKPVITTLHTILGEPTEVQRKVLGQVCSLSAVVVVMAERARELLTNVYGVLPEKIRLIHHGVPDVPFVNPDDCKDRFEVAGRPTILTFGLLSPNKSIEVTLDALAKVVPSHPDLAYIILGVTHPGVKRESGESYRLSLEARAARLGIADNVIFHNRYVSQEDLCEFLKAADLYVTPYRGKDQITSGTLAYAVATGKAVISTPYYYAQEMLDDGRGRLVDFDDVDGFAAAFNELLSDEELRQKIRKRAYVFGRQMIWANVAAEYERTFVEAREIYGRMLAAPALRRRAGMRLSLPEARLDHLYVMSDDTGIAQHAIYSTPDRRHGYCTDDNARALMVAAMAWMLLEDETVLPRLQVYLSFLHHAMGENGRFRNFLSYDRQWLESEGSEDSQGRAMWSLGYLVAHAPDENMKSLGKYLFENGVRDVETIRYPRSWAFLILGFHYFLRHFHGASAERRRLEVVARRLNDVFKENETDDWPWYEPVVTYDNGRLPQALILGGQTLGDQDMIDRGLRVLEWLLKAQTAEEGHLSVIGHAGWMTREGHRAVFDQQPLEAAALVDATKAAFRVTEDRRWLGEMRRCFEWFLGRNELGIPPVDFKTRGCADGLQPDGLNRNQGAESTLSWLLALLTMHEMQISEDARGVEQAALVEQVS